MSVVHKKWGCKKISSIFALATPAVSYIIIFYLTAPTEDSSFVLNSQFVNDIWRLYTYSVFHSSSSHLFLNVAGYSILSTTLYFDIDVLRLLFIHFIAIIHGAWGLGWHFRVTGVSGMASGGIRYAYPGIICVGSSAGVYGFYGCIISVIILQWSHIWIWRRVFYVTQIVIFLIAEVVSSIVFYDLQTSYSGHLGGFIGGFLTGCAVININNDAVMQWKKNVKYASIIILSVVSGAGCANYLM